MDIYGTLGSACADTDTLEAMFRAGMTGVRLNLSHVALRDAGDQLARLREAAARPGFSSTCRDLSCGWGLPSPLPLESGGTVTLGTGGIPVPALTLPHMLPGREVLLDDGKLLLRVAENWGDAATAQSPFGKRIAHALLPAGYISTVLGMILPGPGTVYLHQSLDFKAPVKIGDTVTATVTVTEVLNLTKGIYKLRTTCTNQHGEPLADGEAVVKYAP